MPLYSSTGERYDHHLYKTAKADTQNIKAVLPQMKYADMHCDSITVCCNSGEDALSSAGQVTVEKLKKAGCIAQCFAIFTTGENAAGDFDRFSAFYNDFLSKSGLIGARSSADIPTAASGKTAAVLTVENLEFIGDDLSRISALKKAGVAMASLTWNNANQFAGSALSGGGLTPLGKEAALQLAENRIIIDISHLSYEASQQVFKLAKAPVAASHSNCFSVCKTPRNLTDGQLRAIADSGGVAGLNFHLPFIGGEEPFEGLYLHLRHMIDVGGENLPAIGSDFDGIPRCPQLYDCTCVGKLFGYFSARKIPHRILEKVAFKNFLRVFEKVCG